MKLGSQGLEVSAQGLGCMGMSAFYGPPKPELNMVALIHHAVAAGVTFLDTSDVYGPHTNKVLLGKVGSEAAGSSCSVCLIIWFCCYVRCTEGVRRNACEQALQGGVREIRGDPAYVRAACVRAACVRAACEGSLKRLGVDCVDLYYQHRIDKRVPIEVTVSAISLLLDTNIHVNAGGEREVLAKQREQQA